MKVKPKKKTKSFRKYRKHRKKMLGVSLEGKSFRDIRAGWCMWVIDHIEKAVGGYSERCRSQE
jgi:hypothetical protein